MSVEGDKSARFPCVEQPTRVTLHCNGYYLWCKRNGKLICRKKRNEKDEFLLEYDSEGTLSIQHYKFKGTMTVTRKPLEDGSIKTSIKCLTEKDKDKDIDKDKDEEEKKQKEDSIPYNEETERVYDEEEDKDKDKDEEEKKQKEDITTTNEDKDDDEEDDEQDDDEEVGSDTIIYEDDKKWCFIKGAADSVNANAILLKSLSTGLNLGINDEGKIMFADDEVSPTNIYWTVECVTGELCFLSNPKLKTQVRCDMAGLLTLDSNMKGWEVFRFMEAGHGYVKISSWMHSQWLLCSTQDGTVSTCTHAQSFKDFRPEDEITSPAKKYRCSKWAIEKNSSPEGEGVILRSKTHGRLLSIRENGELRTYHPDDDKPKEATDEDDEDDSGSAIDQSDANASASPTWKSFRNSMRSSYDGARKSMQSKKEGPLVPEAETTVWQLEAAHSQNYFLLSLNMSDPKAKAKSIGPGVQVTPNLRKNTKIQLVRDANDITNTKLCVEGTDSSSKLPIKQYVACQADGSICLLNDDTYIGVEWIMDKSQTQQGCTIFKSKAHGRYLSFRQVDTGDEKGEPSAMDKMNSILGKEKEILEELFGSETLGVPENWKLDPCMPRAVSSDKIKVFAIGTSIAVGTTVAMPFALAGVAGLMGAIGAEVGTFTTLVFAGLTGAEAIASVGAIGATAYLVFKPDENSLTDDHTKEEEEEERAWSKRPLSNWRSW
jgi:hypothetical protein